MRPHPPWQRRRQGPCRPASGFTLTELMIGLAVAAVLASITVPSLTNLFNRMRLTGVANELASDLQFARSEAVRRRASVLLQPTSGDAGYRITSGGVVLKNVSFAGGLVMGQSTDVTFDQLRATSTPVTIDLRNNAGTMRINVNAMGRVMVCVASGNMSGYLPC